MWGSAERVWEFNLGRFTVALDIEPDYGYRYDGDDEDGETQEKLDSGEYVAFDSTVRVYLNGVEIGRDDLGGSVYASGDEPEFWQAHRTSPPEYRNTLAAKASGRVIGHYFADMVRQAVNEARRWMADAKIAA